MLKTIFGAALLLPASFAIGLFVTAALILYIVGCIAREMYNEGKSILVLCKEGMSRKGMDNKVISFYEPLKKAK